MALPPLSPGELRSLKTALRVLTAIMDYDQPSVSDVKSLRVIAPEYSRRALDELACEVVRRSLSKRATVAAA